MGMIANGAQPILDARKKGMKPAEMILVSLIGRINEKNHTVYADPRKEYEWSWTRALSVCVYTSPTINWRAVARSIAAEQPSFLGVWDADSRKGANVYLLPHPDDINKPQDQWRLILDFLPWLPFQNEEFAWN